MSGRKFVTTSGLTSCKRFAVGLDFAYCNILPLGIHSVIIQKWCGVAEIETPRRGSTFGCEKCFQAIISRQNSWERVEER